MASNRKRSIITTYAKDPAVEAEMKQREDERMALYHKKRKIEKKKQQDLAEYTVFIDGDFDETDAELLSRIMDIKISSVCTAPENFPTKDFFVMLTSENAPSMFKKIGSNCAESVEKQWAVIKEHSKKAEGLTERDVNTMESFVGKFPLWGFIYHFVQNTVTNTPLSSSMLSALEVTMDAPFLVDHDYGTSVSGHVLDACITQVIDCLSTVFRLGYGANIWQFSLRVAFEKLLHITNAIRLMIDLHDTDSFISTDGKKYDEANWSELCAYLIRKAVCMNRVMFIISAKRGLLKLIEMGYKLHKCASEVFPTGDGSYPENDAWKSYPDLCGQFQGELTTYYYNLAGPSYYHELSSTSPPFDNFCRRLTNSMHDEIPPMENIDLAKYKWANFETIAVYFEKFCLPHFPKDIQ